MHGGWIFLVGLPASRVYTPAKKIHVIMFITLYVFIKKILNYILKCFANTVYNVPRFEQGQPKNNKSLTRIGFVDISWS